MTTIALSRVHFPVTTLGPGRRVGVWFQGCSLRCPGCISVDTWALGRETSLAEVITLIAGWAEAADGLTVSGGEPFDQPEALTALLEAWRRLSRAPVLVFTGYALREIEAPLGTMAGSIDALVTGRFRSDLPQTLALRGSDNQALHILSEAGEAFRSFERRRTDADRRLDVQFELDGGVWFAGIPERGDLARLRRTLAAAGHRLVTSDRAEQAA